MSEERKMILQMLADGKISADEAESLLQAIDSSERAAAETVVEGAQRIDWGEAGLHSLGRTVDGAVRQALEALSDSFRALEERIGQDEARRAQLKDRVEERIRRSTEQALERALRAEERAAQAAERAKARMQEQHGWASRHSHGSPRSHRFEGKDRAEGTEDLTLAAQPGDRFILENRVGDIRVEFADGDEIQVALHKTAWGKDPVDASQRLDSIRVRLVRNGSDVRVEVERSNGLPGFLQGKESQIDFSVRLPHETSLKVVNGAGNIQVMGDPKTAAWEVGTRVGDVELRLPEEIGFAYDLRTRVGEITIDLAKHPQSDSDSIGASATGTYGEGQGRIDVKVEVGDIRLHH